MQSVRGLLIHPSLQQQFHATGDYSKARLEFEARQLMGRLAHVDEISSLVAFLAPDESSFYGTGLRNRQWLVAITRSRRAITAEYAH